MDPCLKAVSCVFSVLETTVDAKFRKQGNESKRNFIKLRHRKDIIYQIVIRVIILHPMFCASYSSWHRIFHISVFDYTHCPSFEVKDEDDLLLQKTVRWYKTGRVKRHLSE